MKISEKHNCLAKNIKTTYIYIYIQAVFFSFALHIHILKTIHLFYLYVRMSYIQQLKLSIKKVIHATFMLLLFQSTQ